MKKTRRRYDRDFKISIIAELEGGKTSAQIARVRGSHLPHVNIDSISVCLQIYW